MGKLSLCKLPHRKTTTMTLGLILVALLCMCYIAKSQEDPFAWMEERIQHDLRAFETISIRELDHLEQSLLATETPFTRLKIQKGNPTYTAPSLRPQHLTRVDGYIRYLKEIHKTYPLPDTDFLIILDDGFNQNALQPMNAPVFCGAKTKSQDRVLVLPELFLYPQIYRLFKDINNHVYDFSWEEKIEIGYWRGSTTGGWYTADNWTDWLRTRLVMFSETAPKVLNCAFTAFCQGSPEAETAMRTRGLFKKNVDAKAQLKYKYLIAIDGNTCASSLKWQMFSGSVVLKNDSEWIEWYDTAMLPYRHYVPYKPDFSDLPEKIKWLKKNDAIAHSIAAEARRFAEQNLTKNGAELYTCKLLTAYSKRLVP